MTTAAKTLLPAGLAAELERTYFWWENVGGAPRSDERILAQAMDRATFVDVRRLERTLGAASLIEAMLRSESGWISDRSWEFWRGRLARAIAVPDKPPGRVIPG